MMKFSISRKIICFVHTLLFFDETHRQIIQNDLICLCRQYWKEKTKFHSPIKYVSSFFLLVDNLSINFLFM